MTNHGGRWIQAAIAAQSLLWLINGLVCKVLGFVPRHEAIVGRILGAEHAGLLTMLIGLSEILMAIWIATAIRFQLAIIAQMMLVAGMNTLEAFLAPDLLLFGYGNAVLAFAYIILLVIFAQRIRSVA